MSASLTYKGNIYSKPSLLAGQLCVDPCGPRTPLFPGPTHPTAEEGTVNVSIRSEVFVKSTGVSLSDAVGMVPGMGGRFFPLFSAG